MAKYTDKLWLLVAGVAVLGFNLRGAITSLPPVFPELQHRMQLSPPAMSLLAATPVICFGVVSACAAWLARRVGEERALLGAAVLLTCGLALRGLAPGTLLFPGTALAASAIAIMNVLLSSLVKRRWPKRAGLLIGIYLTTLSLGAITGSLLSVPLWHASNGSVRLTLGWLAIPAALAVLAWLPQAGHRTAPGTDASRIRVYRKALAWQVMAFMGLQSLLYYATLSWLPTIFRDRGVSPGAAGNLLALMGLGNFATSLLVPVLAARMRGQRALAVPAVFGLAAGIAGCVWAPVGGAVAWVLLLGVAQGAALALAIFFTMARAADPVTAASLSAFAQSAGYLIASAGPLEVGLLHSATGGWNVPVMLLLILTGAELIAGLLAARPLTLGEYGPLPGELAGRGDCPRERFAGQPLPEIAAPRPGGDVPAGDLARYLDPQLGGYVMAPRGANVHVAAAHRHLVGIHHDPWLGDQPQVAAADLRLDVQRGLRDHGLGKVQQDVAAPDLDLHIARHHPAAVALGAAASAVDARQLLDLNRGRTRAYRGGGQIGGQRHELGICPGGHGQLDPLVELGQRQAPVARRHPQLLDHLVAVLMRGAQRQVLARLPVSHGQIVASGMGTGSP
jgi:CP family cyanate transporter-like MFS transporter